MMYSRFPADESPAAMPSASGKSSSVPLCRFLCAAFLCLLAAGFPKVCAAPLPEAEILLLHRYDVSAEETRSLRVLMDTLTFLGHSVTLATPQEAAGKLDEYACLIAYALEETDPALAQAFSQSTAPRVVLGTAWMRALSGEKGASPAAKIPVLLRYPLKGEGLLEGVGEMDAPPPRLDPDYAQGSVIAGQNAYPLFAAQGSLLFTPVTELATPLMRTALARELAAWMWPYRDTPPDFAQYLVVSGVFPFEDPAHLQAIIEQFRQARLPFVLSVMPLTQNTDYPAFERFCAVLRYAQQSGGAILLHAPLIQVQTPDREALFELLTEAQRAYGRFGVYPLGLQAPQSWIYSDFYRELLARYSTVFLHPDGDAGFSLSEQTNPILQSGTRLIAPAVLPEPGGHHTYSTALYLGTELQAPELERLIRQAQLSTAPTKDLWSMAHKVYGNAYFLHYDGSRLTVDGTVRAPEENIPLRQHFSYRRNMLRRITVDLSRSNRGAVLFVLLAFAVFTACILLARRKNKKSFFHD